ncbi:MAG: YebC/PmpR family DNA-binding transcriptional regulator [Legionellales bacterium]|nr:YebC/PmpR family DNA-binding transcriptional regulator [Legionellales bacterium]|tara:strand:- start:5071 stop:5808 length:738 start_codon:yes stop_codon:yes gene_type:complete
MAGHSKWANIRHKKAKEDAKRGKIFTKLIREITVAARMGGGDPDGNPRLRAAIDNGLSNNMSKDTIDRAVKRGAGGGEGENVEEIIYEGYGPGGVAVMVECMTDNRNRTVAEVRHAFSKCGGNLGTDGSVSYLFSKQGLIILPSGTDEEHVMEVALEAGAEDISSNTDGTVEVITTPETFVDIKTALVEGGFTPDSADVTMIASNEVAVDTDGAEKLLRLLDMLEDLDDVQNVHSNVAFPDDFEG